MKRFILVTCIIFFSGLLQAQEKLSVTKKGLILQSKIIKVDDLDKKKSYILDIAKDVTCEDITKNIPVEFLSKVRYLKGQLICKYHQIDLTEKEPPPTIEIRVYDGYYMYQGKKKSHAEIKQTTKALINVFGDEGLIILLSVRHLKSHSFSKMMPIIKLLPSQHLCFATSAAEEVILETREP